VQRWLKRPCSKRRGLGRTIQRPNTQTHPDLTLQVRFGAREGHEKGKIFR
jgi:hypothetical protein